MNCLSTVIKKWLHQSGKSVSPECVMIIYEKFMLAVIICVCLCVVKRHTYPLGWKQKLKILFVMMNYAPWESVTSVLISACQDDSVSQIWLICPHISGMIYAGRWSDYTGDTYIVMTLVSGSMWSSMCLEGWQWAWARWTMACCG